MGPNRRCSVCSVPPGHGFYKEELPNGSHTDRGSDDTPRQASCAYGRRTGCSNCIGPGPRFMSRPHLLLVGCGHAHLFVLEALARGRLEGVSTTLISPSPDYFYSGMMPGIIAGCYRPEEARFRPELLAAAAGADWICGHAARVDPWLRRVTLENGQSMGYDVLSLDIGSALAGDEVPGVREYAVGAKPMRRALHLLPRLEAVCRSTAGRPLEIVLAGGGAAGVEVSFCLDSRLAANGGAARHRITVLEAGEAILAGYSRSFRERARQLLRERGIVVRTRTRVRAAEQGSVRTVDGSVLACDLLFWAAGPKAPDLPHASGLPHDGEGYLLVRSTLQCVAHPEIFAAGDCVTLAAAPWVPKAGVYAVRQGPLLVRNLERFLRGGSLSRYRPQRHWLSLMNTGDGSALGSYRGLAYHGTAAWWLKDRIDRRFMRRFQRLESER
jgi:pyridine nucleotide-disulfide oxidoreductase family protein